MSAPVLAKPGKLTAVMTAAAAADLSEISLPPAPASRTPQLLRRYQLLSVIVLLLLGLGAATATMQLRTALSQGPGIVDQYARIGTVHSELLTAGNAAARNLLAPSTANRKQLTSSLDHAHELLLQAAAERPQDAEQLQVLSAGLIDYDRLLSESAGGSGSSARAALVKADALLDAQLAPAIDSLRAQLASEAGQDSWSGWAWLLAIAAVVALAVLIMVSVGTARITHRYLNRGVVGALLAAVVIVILGATAINRAGDALDLDQSSELQTTVSIASGRAALNQVDRLQLRGALDHTWSTKTTAAVTQATRVAQATARANKATLAPALRAVIKTQEGISTRLTKNDWTGAARTLTSTQSATGLADVDTAANTATATTVKAAAQQLTDAAWVMLALVIAQVIVTLIAMVLALWGLDRVLREYR